MRNVLTECVRLANIEKTLDSTTRKDTYLHLQDQQVECEARIRNALPSGSGFDATPELVTYTDEKVVLYVPFHHMNPTGYYDGWVTYVVTVTPRFTGPDIAIRVKGYNSTARKYATENMRDYIAEVYLEALTANID